MNTNNFDVDSSHNKKTLIIDKLSFNKAAKRLAKELTNIKELHPKWSASQTQELLAKSFGFNNYHAANQFYNSLTLEKTIMFPSNRTRPFLNDWSSDQIIKFFVILSSNNSDDMWAKRGVMLITLIINILKYLSEQKELIISAESIAEHLNFHTLLKLYKRKDLPNELKFELKTYLTSLPGFQESAAKQNDTVVEQHGYLQMQFSSSIKDIQRLEAADPLIINPHWYMFQYLKININDKEINVEDLNNRAIYGANNKNKDTKTPFVMSLKDEVIESVAANFSSKDWHELFSEKKSTSNETYFVNKKDKYEYIFLKGITLHSDLQYDAQIEDTWLSDSTFNSILLGLIRSKQLKVYYLTDLLLYSFNIVNKEKQY